MRAQDYKYAKALASEIIEAWGQAGTEGKPMKCPQCKSKLVYIRIKTQEGVCRACGNIWPMAKATPSTTAKEAT